MAKTPKTMYPVIQTQWGIRSVMKKVVLAVTSASVSTKLLPTKPAAALYVSQQAHLLLNMHDIQIQEDASNQAYSEHALSQ